MGLRYGDKISRSLKRKRKMNNNLKKEKQQTTLFTKVVATTREQKLTKRNRFRHVGDIIFRRSAAHNKWRPQCVTELSSKLSSSFRVWTAQQHRKQQRMQAQGDTKASMNRCQLVSSLSQRLRLLHSFFRT